ncbi:hypothetical protein CVT25_014398 [Psilocybe cyanescens]|uniref:ATP-dependent DNA helicase n=1 Tax=Psilocybe cyanescens TaxID=93625 RepID=A0A409XBJ4_PSICY|nr:hypothetical protein CVT25_014398 [Psilocybe cyanescens]
MENKSIDVAITATTGVAGLNIGGMTIHSFAGFGLGKGKQEDLAEKVNRSAKSRNRWCQTRILIIDEISMLDGELFDKLVPFIDILTNMRYGTLTDHDEQKLSSLSRPLTYPDGIEPSQLFPLRNDVENHNKLKLQALPEPTLVYPAMDSAGYDIHGIPISRQGAEKLLERMISPSMISLKVGAQVMLIQNVEKGVLVNGSLGKVVGFTNIRDAQERHIAIAELASHSNSSYSPPTVSKEFRPLANNTFSRQQLWPIVSVFAHQDVIDWHKFWSSLGDGGLSDGTDDDARSE